MSIFVSEFSVDIGCPGTLPVNSDGTTQASMSCKISNDGSTAETVSIGLKAVDTDGNEISNFDSVSVSSGGAVTQDLTVALLANYSARGRKTATATATAAGETKSTLCTFSVT